MKVLKSQGGVVGAENLCRAIAYGLCNVVEDARRNHLKNDLHVSAKCKLAQLRNGLCGATCPLIRPVVLPRTSHGHDVQIENTTKAWTRKNDTSIIVVDLERKDTRGHVVVQGRSWEADILFGFCTL